MSRRAWVLGWVVCTVGCDPGVRGATTSALGERPVLVVADTVWSAPPQADGETRVRLAWRLPGGMERAITLPEDAVAWSEWGQDAAVVGARGGLYKVSTDGAFEKLADDAVGTPAASDDGARLAYVVRTSPEHGALHVRDADADHVLASELSACGVLRFAPDASAVLFVGASDGGVAALSVADARGVRCLTNCALVAGRDWGDPYVPPPGEPRALVFDGARVSWVAFDGKTYEATWR